MRILKPYGENAGASLRVSLGDRDAATAEALAAAFAGADGVEVVAGDILLLDSDAIVSPANSFGDMGGGIDKAIDDFHRGEAQRLVMAAIAREYCGELPVGAALAVPLPGRRFRCVVAAPTMRVPGDVSGTINAYLAMRAALVEILRYNSGMGEGQIRTIAIPGLGTGIGRIPAPEAAEQMRAAYDNIIGGRWRGISHPAQAPYASRRAHRPD